MHAHRIIQDLLATECPSIHAKRRACVAAMTQAGSKGGLSLMGISRVAHSPTSLRHRIKQCDRLLGNSKLAKERHLIYGAMARRILHRMAQPLIIVDWSDLCADRSQQLLRAALMVQGRALTLYEEVHPLSRAASLSVHRAFLKRLQALLPAHSEPVFITDAGFRSTWFTLLDSMGYAWIGRIRNRDMVRPLSGEHAWHGCKTLYANHLTFDLDGTLSTDYVPERGRGHLPCGSEHELPDGTAHGKKLWAIHVPDDLTDDRRHDPLHARQPEVRRLFHDETWLRSLQWLHEAVVHATLHQFHYDIRESVAVLRGIGSLLDSTE